MSTDAKLKTEKARQALPWLRLLEQHGYDLKSGDVCPCCHVGKAQLRPVDGRMISERTIQQVKERADIVRVIGSRVAGLKKSGAQFAACCPFHNEKSPSFYVSEKKKSWKCFGCAAGGDVFRFLTLKDGLKFGEAVEQLARECGVPLEFEKEDREELVCSNKECKAHEGLDEAGYMAVKLGCSSKDGWVAWLREAGVLKRNSKIQAPASKVEDFSGNNAPDDGDDDDQSSTLTLESDPASTNAGPDAAVDGVASGPVPPAQEGDDFESLSSGGEESAIADPESPAPGPFGNGGEIPSDAPQQRRDGLGAGGSGERQKSGGVKPKRNPLLEFWRRCAWTEESAQKMELDRGLPAEASRLLGFRTNRRENLAVLEALREEFSEEELCGCGLFQKWEDRVIPNRQFYGWGLMGSLERMRRAGKAVPAGAKVDAEGNAWFWTEPVLIPYWEEFMGEDGVTVLDMVGLRPHKGGAKGQPSRLYVPMEVKEDGVSHDDKLRSKFSAVVVCESEFKAAAIWWVFRGTRFAVGACGLPGISQGANEGVRWPMVEWMREVGARKVVVAFDSEEKGDPRLPGWKADPKKRYDAEAWSRYLAKWTSYQDIETGVESRDRFDGLVGVLPATWRDASGKADWDGVLARMWSDSGSTWNFKSDARSGSRKQEIGTEFLKVINGAVRPGDARQAHLFSDWEERIISDRLHAIWYEPKLPWGDSAEKKLAEKLIWLVEKSNGWVMGRYCLALAKAFESVVGWSFDRRFRVIKSEDDAQFAAKEPGMIRDLLKRERDVERRKLLRAKLAFYEEYAKGIPNRASNFKIDPVYMLIRRSGDKEDHERMVVLKNQMGEKSKPVLLPMEWLDTPARFKRWTGLRGRYDWMEGEDSLQWLRYDLNQGLLGKDVHEVNEIGWNASGRFWIFGDCAIEGHAAEKVNGVGKADEAKAMAPALVAHPDEHGIVYVGGVGYQLSDADWENQDFKLGKPMMRPTMGLHFAKKSGSSEDDYVLREHKEDELDALRDLWGEFVYRMREMIAVPAKAGDLVDYDGYLLIGSMSSYAAAPEFFKKEGYFPGAWVNGERGSGKGFRSGMLMRMWGFSQDAFVSLHGTKVGIAIALQQYCNLPVRLEEAKNLPSDLVELLKGTHNRETPPKFELTGRSRKIHTAPLIVGEHTARDSALAQRFPAVNVSKQRRKRADGSEVDHKAWFQRNSDFFFSMGRHLLRHRRRYVELTLQHWEEWMQDPALRKTEDRCRGVHGLAYAGFMAAAEVFGVPGKAELAEFRRWMVNHTIFSSGEVVEQVNVNIVWQHIVNAFKSGVFGETPADRRRYFKSKYEPAAHPPGAESQSCGDSGFGLIDVEGQLVKMRIPQWRSYVLYFDYQGVWDRLQEHWRHIGENPPMTRNDFRAQMQSHPYFMKPRNASKTIYQRMHGYDTGTAVWGILLDYHPMGYCPRPDAEVLESFVEAAREEKVESEWADPRQGELYLICRALE